MVFQSRLYSIEWHIMEKKFCINMGIHVRCQSDKDTRLFKLVYSEAVILSFFYHNPNTLIAHADSLKWQINVSISNHFVLSKKSRTKKTFNCCVHYLQKIAITKMKITWKSVFVLCIFSLVFSYNSVWWLFSGFAISVIGSVLWREIHARSAPIQWKGVANAMKNKTHKQQQQQHRDDNRTKRREKIALKVVNKRIQYIHAVWYGTSIHY